MQNQVSKTPKRQKKLKVLALVTDAFGGFGGIAQYNRDFLQAVSASKYVETITVLPRLAPGVTQALPAGARQLAPIRNQILYSLKAIGLALRERPDVVFCGHLYMAPLGAIVAKLTGAKLVLQTHGIEVWPKPSAMQRAAVESADIVLCVSRNTRARLLDWTNPVPEKVVVTPNTVAMRYSPGDGRASRARLGLQDKTILFSVSRLDASQQYKGQDRVIGLLLALRERGRDVVFVIGGSGDDRSRLEALARDHGVADHVRFLGEVTNDELLDLYRAADLYLMPSSGEGFGIVFLEAMACGTPALGLALGGAPDALGRGLGDAVDDGELLDAIERALNKANPEPNALASEVRRRYGEVAFRGRIAGAISRLMDSSRIQSPAMAIRG